MHTDIGDNKWIKRRKGMIIIIAVSHNNINRNYINNYINRTYVNNYINNDK